jgi:hypothetical protein
VACGRAVILSGAIRTEGTDVRRTHKIRTACAGLISAAALILSGLTFVAPAAQAAQIGPGYYLFYRTITSIHANCAGSTRYLRSAGTVNLKPYRVWNSPKYATVVRGSITSYYFHQNGFSTAYRQEWCRKHDYVYQYYGRHKVRRNWRQDWLCISGGCAPLGNYFTAWKSYNWS